MATMNLNKPSSAIQQSIVITEETTDFGFDFDIADAILERVDNNLLISFDEDGSSILLEDFYTVYNAEFMPNFLLDGEVIAGEDFFAALDENLMPAAGPAAAAVAGGGRFYDLDTDSLASGIDALSGLDGGSAYSVNPFLEDGAGVNTPPSILGIVPDEGSEPLLSSPADVNIYESGVGREANGTVSLDFNNENNPFSDNPAGGTVLATDPNGDPLTFSVLGSPNGVYGTFSIDPLTGQFTYTLLPGEAGINSLAEGDAVQETFTVQVADGQGGTVATTITVSITGTNDQPVIELEQSMLSGEVTEDGDSDDSASTALSFTGQIVASDVDTGDDLAYGLSAPTAEPTVLASDIVNDTMADSFNATYGTVSINPETGEYTYTLYAENENQAAYDAVQGLGENETLPDTFTVWVQDEKGAWTSEVVNITVTGTNDVPVIGTEEITDVELSTKDEDVLDGNAVDQGYITFTSAETMDGGQITIGDKIFTVTENADGTLTLTPPVGKDMTVSGSNGNLVVEETVSYNPATDEYTVEFQYKQTSAYGHDNDENGDSVPDNIHDQVKENAESFDVKIQDGKESSTGAEYLQTTITVDITDDGPKFTEAFKTLDSFLESLDELGFDFNLGIGTGDVVLSENVTDSVDAGTYGTLVEQFGNIISNSTEEELLGQVGKLLDTINANPATLTQLKVLLNNFIANSNLGSALETELSDFVNNYFDTILPSLKADEVVDHLTADADITENIIEALKLDGLLVDYGADGKASLDFSYELSPRDKDSGLTSGGENISFVTLEDGTIQGQLLPEGTAIFEVSVDSTTGKITLTQKGPIDHKEGSDEEILGGFDLNVTVKAEDADGDTITEDLKIPFEVSFTDTIPTVTVSKGADANITLTTTDIVGDKEPNSSADFSAVFTENPIYGADGEGTTVMSYTLGLKLAEGETTVSSNLTSGGNDIILSVVDGKIVGTANGATIFEISVNSKGVVSMTQSGSIDHDAPSDSMTTDELKSLADELITLTATATTTDFDGDVATGSATINIGANLQFGDDKPTVTVTKGAEVTETVLSYQGEGDDGTKASDPTADNTSIGKGTLALDFGADGQHATNAFAWDVSIDADDNYINQPNIWSSEGTKITWTANGDVLTGTADGKTILTITMEKDSKGEYTGNYTVELKESIMHDAPESDVNSDYNTDTDGNGIADSKDADSTNEDDSLEFGFTITDGDGDAVSGKVTVKVEDDIIELTNTTGSVTATPTADIYHSGEVIFDKSSWNNSTITGLTITTGTMTYEDATTGEGATLNTSNGGTAHWFDVPSVKYKDGIGINGGANSGELDYSGTTKVSEALILDLPEGSIAYGANINLGCFFTGSTAGSSTPDTKSEMVLVQFYLNGKLVHSTSVTSADTLGNDGASLSGMTSGFDRIVISALDNGALNNSDFVLTGIEFLQPDDYVAVAKGDVDASAADGFGSFFFDYQGGETITIDGVTLTLSFENGALIATDKAGTKYFTATIGSEDGSWTLHQHVAMEDNIILNIGAKDKDGDKDTISVTITPASKVGLEITDTLETDEGSMANGTHAGFDGDDTDTLSDHIDSGIIVIKTQDPLNEIKITFDGHDLIFDASGNLVSIDGNSTTAITTDKGILSDFKLEVVGDSVNFTYKYEQAEAITHDSDNNTESDKTGESFDVTVSTSTGLTASVTVGVTVTDDLVDIKDVIDSADVYADPNSEGKFEIPEATKGLDGTVITPELIGKIDVLGADGVTLDVAIAPYHGTVSHAANVTVNGEKKVMALTLEENSDGTFTIHGVEGQYTDGKLNILDTTNPYFIFTFNPDTNEWTFEQHRPFEGDINIEIKGTDTDLDFDKHTLTFVGTEKGFPVSIEVQDILETDEGSMSTGIHAGQDVDKDGASDHIDSGSLYIETSDTPNEITITIKDASGNNVELTFDASGKQVTGPTSINTPNGILSGFNLKDDVDGGVEFNYTYTQDTAVKHEAPNADSKVTTDEVAPKGDSFEVTVGTSNGSASTTVDVTITDDVPESQKDVTIQNVTGNETDGYTASTIVELNFGADNGDGKTIEFGDATFTYDAETDTWTTDSAGKGEVLADGTLSVDGMTLSQNGNTDYWSLEMSGGKGETTWNSNSDITITDADGDSESLKVTANSEDVVTGEKIGLAGEFVSLAPGQNYNIAIILDTSGSMYDDNHKDIVGDATRLGQACEAIADFVVNTLKDHADKGIEGGTVNLLLTTFWNNTENGGTDVYTGQGEKTYIGGSVDLSNLSDMTEQEIYEYIAQVLVDNAKGVTSTTDATGKVTFHYDYESQDFKDIVDALKDDEKQVDDYYNPLAGANTGFHWGTDYHSGFENAAEWFNSIQATQNPADDFINEAFLITDGEPHDSQLERVNAYNDLLIAMGIVDVNDKDTHPKESDGRYKVELDASDNKIHAVGMGTGADQETLDKFDTTATVKDDPETLEDETKHNSTLVKDSNISDLFTPGEGSSATLDSTHIGFTKDGSDILMGDVNLNNLRKAFGASYSLDEYGNPVYSNNLDSKIMDFLRNNPEWLLDEKNLSEIEYGSNAANNDALIAGAGDDFVYGQGGDDILIGDGDFNALEILAEKLNVSGDYSYKNVTDSTNANLGITTGELVDGLLDAVYETDPVTGELTIKEGAIDKLIDAAAALKADDADGNDIIYGGDGNDIIFALGGNDSLTYKLADGSDDITNVSNIVRGGKGDDILIAGDAADIFVWKAEDLGGTDYIVGFDTDEDIIDLTQIGDDLKIEASNENGNGIIEILDGDTIVQTISLQDTALSQEEIDTINLNADIDFIKI